MTFLIEAIEVTEDPTEIAELLERAGEAADLGGSFEQAKPLLRDAIERREALGDRSGAARATALLGQGVVNAWRAKEAAEILEPAVAAFGDLVDDPALAAIEHQLARAYWFQDENEEADRSRRPRARAGGAHRGCGARRGRAHHEGCPAGLHLATVRGRRLARGRHPARRVARPQSDRRPRTAQPRRVVPRS